MKLRTRDGYFWVDARYWDAPTGKRIRVQRSTGVRNDGTKSAERTAQVIAEDICRTIAISKERRAHRFTIADAFAANVAEKKRANRSAHTFEIVENKRANIEAHFTAKRELNTLRAEDFAAYADAARAAGRAPATILRELRELVFGMRVLKLDPPDLPDLGRISNPQESWLTFDQTVELLKHVQVSKREHVIAYRLTGVRYSELFRLERGDVDVATWMLRVRGTKTANADRWLPVHPDLRPILLRRMKERPSGALFEPWIRGNGNRDLKLAGKKANLGPLSFNALRRSFAMELLRAGKPTREVAELLGHTSTRMVESHYGRLSPGAHLTGAVDSLQSGYASVSSFPPPAPMSPTRGPRKRDDLGDDQITEVYVRQPTPSE